MLPESYITGAISTADRVTNMHQEAWDGSVFKYMPIGHVPVTGILDAMGKVATPSRHIHWWEEPFQKQRGSIIEVYTTNPLGLSPTTYVTGGTAGNVVYLTMLADDARQVIPGNTLLIQDPATYEFLSLDVISTTIGDDASTYVSAALLSDDDEDVLAATTPYFTISSTAYEELSGLPEPQGRDLVESQNQTQILMGALEVSGTEIEEDSRIDEGILPAEQRRGLMRLMTQAEWTSMFGVYKTKTGPKGKPRRFARGVVTALKENVPQNFFNFKTDTATAISGKTFKNGGWDYLKYIMDQTQKWDTGAGRVELFLGMLSWRAINDLVEDRGHYQIVTQQSGFGIEVRTLYGLQKPVNLILHPLFSENPMFERCGWLTQMGLMKIRPMRNRDITYIPGDRKDPNGYVWVDGVKAGWMAEWTFQYSGLPSMAWISGFGVDNINP
jgi:hypothetical protein